MTHILARNHYEFTKKSRINTGQQKGEAFDQTFFPSCVGDPALDEAADASAEVLSETFLKAILFRELINTRHSN